MNRFDKQTVIVTGGAGGIGRATAERLAAEGANIVIADYNKEEAVRLAEQLRGSHGVQAEAVWYDALDPDGGAEVVRKTLECFGSIHCLVNNVGGSDLKRDLDVLSLDMDYFSEVFQLNLKSMLALTRAALPDMVARKKGSIVNVASVSGLLGDFRGSFYGMSKAGVISLTRYIATQYGRDGVRCNGVAPGLVLTPAATRNLPESVRQVFLKYNTVPYLGEPADVAATIAFLASDDARYLSGQTLVVDGGMSCHNPAVEEVAAL